MKESETKAIIIMPRVQWNIVKLISGRLMVAEDDGKVRKCTASDIVREMVLDEWLGEQFLKFYPKLLKEFKEQGITNEISKYLMNSIMQYAEYLVFNTPPITANTLTPEQRKGRKEMLELTEEFKKSMLDAHWTESEFEGIMKEATEALKREQG